MIYTKKLNLPIVEDDDSMSLVFTQGNESNSKLEEKLSGYDEIPEQLSNLRNEINKTNTNVTNLQGDFADQLTDVEEIFNNELQSVNLDITRLKSRVMGGSSGNGNFNYAFDKDNALVLNFPIVESSTLNNVIRQRGTYLYSFNFPGIYHVVFRINATSDDPNAVGLMKLSISSNPPTPTDMRISTNALGRMVSYVISNDGTLILDTTIQVTNPTDTYMFAIYCTGYKVGHVHNDEGSNTTLFVEKIVW